MVSSVFCFFEFTAPEILLILFVTLLLFGGEKLPQLARGLGKGIRDFKEASEGVKREITSQIDNFETKKKEDELTKTAEEPPLIAEHAADNPEGTAPESHVVNTMPINESSHITATDQVELELPAHKELHQEQETHGTEAGNTTHE